jgi:hypothetical protein
MSNEAINQAKEQTTTANSPSLEKQIAQWGMQVHVMKTFATTQGKPIAPEVATAVAEAEDRVDRLPTLRQGDPRAYSDARTLAVQKLLAAHGMLCQIVKPATPDTILFSMPEIIHYSFWPPRKLFLMANVGLAAISIALSLSQGLPVENKNLLEMLSLFGAGGLGASFYNLYWIHHYLLDHTFDRQYCASYYIRWAMGLIAGYILAKLVWKDDPSHIFSAALVAALGGFAADSVNDILLRLTETIKTLVAGRGDQAIKLQASMFEAETLRVRAQSQVEMAKQLSGVLAEAQKQGAPDAVLKSLQNVIDSTLGPPSGK